MTAVVIFHTRGARVASDVKRERHLHRGVSVCDDASDAGAFRASRPRARRRCPRDLVRPTARARTERYVARPGDDPAPTIGHIGRYALKYQLGVGGIGTV